MKNTQQPSGMPVHRYRSYSDQFRTHLADRTWPEGHPYSWTTIGSEDDLNAATLDDVRAWFQQHYGAANATLVIAGDSAGGGLALATLQALKAKKIALPSCTILISPWVDLSLNDLFDTDRDIMLSPAWLASGLDTALG